MAPATFFLYVLLLLAAAAPLRFSDCEEFMTRKVHIVCMGDSGGGVPESGRHLSILRDVIGGGGTGNSPAAAEASLVRSYGRSFSGFAAWLTDDEATKIKELEGVVSVFPDTKLKLHTTRSWDFMGFTASRTPRYRHEGDVIVGVIDTGIWPESPSFSDEGLSPPPARWNGTCETGTAGDNFTCNKKIIGARFYNGGNIRDPPNIQSPRDTIGHGTHTASTAAGVEVGGASFYGLARGTARGAVPGARIAVYKVIWSEEDMGLNHINETDLLAAFDDAIADGVDILSVSLGREDNVYTKYFSDSLAIGSFHAMKKGILTVFSAGNDGPRASTLGNTAPWAITVAASSINRRFITKLILGNGLMLLGNSINTFPAGGKAFPLVYGGDAPNASAGVSSDTSSYCQPGSINALKVSGAVVLCVGGDVSGVMMAGGAGAVMTLDDYDSAFSFPLPTAVVTPGDSARILEYIRSADEPIATISAGETIDDDDMSPMVASFSSRGPNIVVPDLLKPDLTAPGIDILAAWSPPASASDYPNVDTRRGVKFNVVSGTSMSCPHVSGAAAYIKSARPLWSPAAIKSALMTTAMKMDHRKNEDAEFAYGAGHIDPLSAVDPGLVFDAEEKDYLAFLCMQGYSTADLQQVSGDPSAHCPPEAAAAAPRLSWKLNYPSFAVAVADGEAVWAVFPRTVTNVGTSNSTYRAAVEHPAGVTVAVSPEVLSFSRIGEKRSFTVTISGGRIWQQPIVSGCITWTDGQHVVRSPVVVHTVLPAAAAGAGAGAPAFSSGRN